MAELAAARRYMHREARLIDRLAFAAAFDGGSSEAVIRALRAYQNIDGGYGHALEPDTRTATSQPLYLEVALGYMDRAGLVDRDAMRRACDWLGAVLTSVGGVPILLETIRDSDFAPRWADGPPPVGINPNGGIAGLLRKLDIDHPVLARLEAFAGPPWRGSTAHTM